MDVHGGTEPRTVLVVDDHAAFRAAARAFLTENGYAVVGEAADGQTALDAAEALRPDVVLLDVQLPDIDGFEIARRLAAMPCPPAIVLVSTRERKDYGHQVEASGATGFVSKSQLSGAAIRAVVG